MKPFDTLSKYICFYLSFLVIFIYWVISVFLIVRIKKHKITNIDDTLDHWSYQVNMLIINEKWRFGIGIPIRNLNQITNIAIFSWFPVDL
jgi:uncharacterized membrane protein SpoIIM required for sporulation